MPAKISPYWVFKKAMERQGMPAAAIDEKWKSMGADEREKWKQSATAGPKQKNDGNNLSHRSDNRHFRPYSSTAQRECDSNFVSRHRQQQQQPKGISTCSATASSVKPHEVTYLARLSKMEAIGEEFVAKFIGNFSQNGLKNFPFLGMSFNVSLKWEHKFYPNEIGAVIFTINDGIEAESEEGRNNNLFHRLIKPGPFPPGSRFLISTHEDKHRIPVDEPPDESVGGRLESEMVKKYSEMLDELLLFMEQTSIGSSEDSRYYFVFVKGNMEMNQVSQVYGSLLFLAEACKHAKFTELLENNRILVVDVSFLALQLMKRMNNDPETRRLAPVLAISICENNSFDYKNPIMCNFHKQKDHWFLCALSVVARMWFCFAEVILKQFPEVEKIPGQHFPVVENQVFEARARVEPRTDVYSAGSKALDISNRGDTISETDSQYSNIAPFVNDAASERSEDAPTIISGSSQIAYSSITESTTANMIRDNFTPNRPNLELNKSFVDETDVNPAFQDPAINKAFAEDPDNNPGLSDKGPTTGYGRGQRSLK